MRTRRSPSRTRCERSRRSRHLAVVSQIVLQLRAIELHDFSARRRITVIVQHEWIAENRVAAVDIDGTLAGAGLSRRSGPLGAQGGHSRAWA